MLGLRLRGPQGPALISAYTIVLGLLFLYMLLPSLLIIVLNGWQYVWIPGVGGPEGILITSLVCIIATTAFICGYLIRLTRKNGTPQQQRAGSKIARILAWSLIVTGLLIKLYIALSSGGIETNIVRVSSGVRDSLGVESISSSMVFLRYLSGIADAGATWLLLEKMRSGKRVLPTVILFTLVISFTFFGAGKRLFLLWPILAALIGVHHYVRPIRIKSLPVIGVFLLGLGFLSLMFRIYAPAFIAGVEIDLNEVAWAHGSLFKFYFFSLEFASFEVLTFVLHDAGRVVALFGSTLDAFYITNIQPFAYFVPRAIWPTKPSTFLDLSHAYRVFVTGGALDANGAVAATILGTSWTLGGFLGLLLTMLGLGRFCRFLDSNPKIRGVPRSLDLCWYALGLVTVFHLFRQGTIAWTAIIVVFQQSGMILGFFVLAIADSSSTRRKRHRHGEIPEFGRKSGGMSDAH
jgi:hypothetical protein